MRGEGGGGILFYGEKGNIPDQLCNNKENFCCQNKEARPILNALLVQMRPVLSITTNQIRAFMISRLDKDALIG